MNCSERCCILIWKRKEEILTGEKIKRIAGGAEPHENKTWIDDLLMQVEEIESAYQKRVHFLVYQIK